MTMIKGLISTVIALWFIGWIFITPNASERINRVCAPTGWLGDVAVSITVLLGFEGQVPNVKYYSDKFEYGCRYTIWRSFYEAAYNEVNAQQ